MERVFEAVPTLRRIWADQGYKGPLVEWVKRTFSCELEVVSRKGKKFKVLPRRWVVERTFAWLSRYRRLVREYEKKPASSIAMIYVASIRIMLKKLWLLLGFEDVIKFELRPSYAYPPCAASTTSSMKENVTKKSDGYAGPTGCVVRVARPTKSPSAVVTTGNKNADDTPVRTVENGLTTSPGPSLGGGISPCRSGSPTCI